METQFNHHHVKLSSHLFAIILIIIVALTAVVSTVLTVQMMTANQTRINTRPKAAEGTGQANNPLQYAIDMLGQEVLVIDAMEGDFDTLGSGTDSRPPMDLGTTQQYTVKQER